MKATIIETISTIIMAKNKKEANQIAAQKYGDNCKYIKPYRYASKGNNFYKFERYIPIEKEIPNPLT